MHYWRVIVVAIALIAAFLTLQFQTPRRIEDGATQFVIRRLEEFVLQGGYSAIFFMTFAEGLVMFMPGTATLLLGAVLARQGSFSLPLVILAASVGFVSGYTTHFAVSRCGSGVLAKYVGLEKTLGRMRNRIETASMATLLLAFFHPHVALVAAIASGGLRLSFPRILLVILIAATTWTTAFAVAGFTLGPLVLEFLGGRVALIAIGGGLLVWTFRGKSRPRGINLHRNM